MDKRMPCGFRSSTGALEDLKGFCFKVLALGHKRHIIG